MHFQSSLSLSLSLQAMLVQMKLLSQCMVIGDEQKFLTMFVTIRCKVSIDNCSSLSNFNPNTQTHIHVTQPRKHFAQSADCHVMTFKGFVRDHTIVRGQ